MENRLFTIPLTLIFVCVYNCLLNQEVFYFWFFVLMDVVSLVYKKNCVNYEEIITVNNVLSIFRLNNKIV